MSRSLMLKLSDEAYQALQRRAEESGQSAAEFAAIALERQFQRDPSPKDAAARQSARERFERHFGELGPATDANVENDLRAFKGFIDEQLANGGADLALDEALARWEYENSSMEEREETIRAIQSGLADIEAGRVRPIEDFDRDFRLKHGLSPRA